MIVLDGGAALRKSHLDLVDPPTGISHPAPPPPYSDASRDPSEPLLPKPKKHPVGRLRKILLASLAIVTVIGMALFIRLRRDEYNLVPGIPEEPVEEDGAPIRCHIPWQPTSTPPDDKLPTHSPVLVGSDPIFDSLGVQIQDINMPEIIGPVPEPFAYTSLKFPTNSSGLYLLGRGVGFSGVVHLKTYEPDPGEANVKVMLHMKSQRPEFVHKVNLCALQRNGTTGLGVYFSPFSPASSFPGSMVRITITVAFPASLGSPLHLESFSTNFQMFEHQIDDLEGLVSFERFELKSTRGAMTAVSIQGRDIALATSSQVISGKFNATRTLSLSTSNAAIEADIGILHNSRQSAPQLDITTTNGAINATVSLYSTNRTKGIEHGGSYQINATTTNNQLYLNIAKSPIDSLLQLSAETSNGLAEVRLNPAFQGTYDMLATNAEHEVKWNSSVPDPSNKGMERTMTLLHVNKDIITGDVWWWPQEKRTSGGHVHVKDTNGDAVLVM